MLIAYGLIAVTGVVGLTALILWRRRRAARKLRLRGVKSYNRSAARTSDEQ
jgi:hypothetical protein